MYQERENLDILFRKTLPEKVLETVKGRTNLCGQDIQRVSPYDYSLEMYRHFATDNLRQYSMDEIDIRYHALLANGKGKKGSIYDALFQYADNILKIDEKGFPVCRIEHLLNWNSITMRLGQDIFTCAWKAYKELDYPKEQIRYQSFVWSPIIKTDDMKLNALLAKGLAENHYHLHGSTQSFALSWSCLMNHPEYITNFFYKKNFSENLNIEISKGFEDNVMPWDMRILYAAMIRAILFKRCLEEIDSNIAAREYMEFDALPLPHKVKLHTEALRYSSGKKIKQKDGTKRCLDYTMAPVCYRVDTNNCNRLLSGERNFLYQCFRMHFRNEFKEWESSLFYAYLLIKSKFRSEIIQTNNLYGFANFANYQDRKKQFWQDFKEYHQEEMNLSIIEAIADNHVVSLEARIMPLPDSKLMRSEIQQVDKIIRFLSGHEESKVLELNISSSKTTKAPLPYHYVVHFPKSAMRKELKKQNLALLPRNYKTRNKVKRNTLALASYLRNEMSTEQRIYGIDACSNEIGCRPETFATEFRYLKHESEKKVSRCEDLFNNFSRQKWGITYHAGEDFLDIVDGLRAIDEAIQFLPFDKYDRIGHAIALGLEPALYYELKKYVVYLPKQDYLDNLMWILFRSLELNISIESNHRASMEEKALSLFREIYYSNGYEKRQGDSLQTYYNSWKLRGDHPDLYKSAQLKNPEKYLANDYYEYMKGESILDVYRHNATVVELYYRYHFDEKVKERGLEPEKMIVEGWYIDCIRTLQDAIKKELYKRNIAIECNPTSNVLIGTFRRYDNHPILRFNSNFLVADDTMPNLMVSINTDDLGVFDTSIENEYALIFCALKRMYSMSGQYNEEQIYKYLDHLRENGINMSFKRKR